MSGQYRRFHARFAGTAWRGMVAEAIDPADVAALCDKLDAPDTTVLSDRPKIKTGSREGYFIKRYNLPGFFTQIRRRFRLARPFKVLAGAEHFAELGIETPRVVAALIENRGLIRRELLVTELLPEDAVLFSPAVEDGEDRDELWRRLRDDLLPLVVKLHDSGWVHGDLSLRNLYYRRGTEICGFIDLDGTVRKSRGGLALPHREKELARIVSSFLLRTRTPDNTVARLREMTERYETLAGVRLDRRELSRRLHDFVEGRR